MKDRTPKMISLDADEGNDLERAFEPLMSLQAILSRAGQHTLDLDADDVATVLGAVLHSAYCRIGHPSRGEIL